ncbi:MAG: NAD(P)H-dependent glycerol-3-phosphate dehydrogenase [Synergistaceae bacterium]|nr:NAD(P)H-dependent glycerol-3-phosphate dehydrogenase [Synergistaceae bacterium]
MNIGVIGTGTWGTALARRLFLNGHTVTAWSAVPEEIQLLKECGKHINLPGIDIPKGIKYTTDLTYTIKKQDLLLLAVPSIYVRNIASQIAPLLKNNQVIVNVSKGIEKTTLMTMTEVIQSEIKKTGRQIHISLVALSGPTHAEEVAIDLPTAIVSASVEREASLLVQSIFNNKCFRVYTNRDIKGIEICGALKNVVALAAGISDGLGFGDNIKAAILTRALAELTRLGIAMGCETSTFYGLAGIGDIIVTATSNHSRNNRAGRLVGQGRTIKEAQAEIGMVVEGVYAIPAALQLARKYSVELPIVKAVDEIINHGKDPKEATLELMTRPLKAE